MRGPWWRGPLRQRGSHYAGRLPWGRGPRILYGTASIWQQPPGTSDYPLFPAEPAGRGAELGTYCALKHPSVSYNLYCNTGFGPTSTFFFFLNLIPEMRMLSHRLIRAAGLQSAELSAYTKAPRFTLGPAPWTHAYTHIYAHTHTHM